MCAVNRATAGIGSKIEIPQRTCVDCKTLGCAHNNGRYPSLCLTAQTGEEDVADLRTSYEDDAQTYAFMQAAAVTTSRGFSEQMCRLEETMDYFHRMGYSKIGLAFCAGVAEEARITAKILRVHGYEVVGYACKVGALSNAQMGLQQSCCNFGSVACNPLMQVTQLNEAGTHVNIVMGLCVGHDSYVYKLSQAPCTTLLTKDKATVNNTGAALYASQTSSLWSRMMRCNPTLAAPGFVSEEELAEWERKQAGGCCC